MGMGRGQQKKPRKKRGSLRTEKENKSIATNGWSDRF
jgi:hypothetical protein